eukprot:TRINITY_DN2168_c0_g1_i1.p1 TRINITY_DN2168_c0_g1~~TRINITY_DN2168_c0_g1_i1.p1  ORF type:complete len:191 (-),score=43.29 TRINITY_DN2168_c0_g1_i1:132-704(-)
MGNSSQSKLSEAEVKQLKQKSEGKLSEEDIKQAFEQWRKAKKIKSGKGTDKSLTLEEFVEYLTKTKNVERLDAENAFKIFDTDGSGTIEFDEFVMSLLLKNSPTPEQFAGICMTIYDEDGDGFITVTEMKKMGHAKLKASGEFNNKKKVEEMDQTIEHLFASIDKNKDGRITRDEIVQAIKLRPELQTLL